VLSGQSDDKDRRAAFGSPCCRGNFSDSPARRVIRILQGKCISYWAEGLVQTTKTLKMAVFWVVAPCCLVEVYRRFRGACCLHLQGPDDGGRKNGNVGKFIPDYMALQPRRQPSSYSLPWKPEILLTKTLSGQNEVMMITLCLQLVEESSWWKW
jgi:hypothetical protein